MKEHEAKNYKEYAAWQRQERNIGRTPGMPTNSHIARNERAFMDQRNALNQPRQQPPTTPLFHSNHNTGNYTSSQPTPVKSGKSGSAFGGLFVLAIIGLVIAGVYGHVPAQQLVALAVGLGVIAVAIMIAMAVLKFVFNHFWLILCVLGVGAYVLTHH
ncbi:hypothetical protein [Caballeronia grimmiae]|uniref:hypothetical protein n=1 Tax=Caballeronia grimmiae TaxID=1071679 RepID=UPI0038BBC1A6